MWFGSRRAGLPLVALLAHALLAGGGAAHASASGASWHPADPATAGRVRGWMREQGSGWVPNLGQVADASSRAAGEVLFSTTRPGAQVLLTTRGLSHVFVEREGEEGPEEGRRGAAAAAARRPEHARWARLELTLAGARIRPERVRTGSRIEHLGTQNFYLAHCPDGVLDVPAYESVTTPEVYPGVDWVVRDAAAEGVHHDFVVHPGADPGMIRLEYAGATAIELADEGRTLVLRTALGEVREGSLACSQDGGRVPVGARFVLEGNVVRVQLDAYDRSRTLVIDPPLAWASYYGGNSYDGPRAIWCDNLNNAVYVVGYTNSTTLPTLDPGGGAYYNGVAPTAQDAFIWKFNQQGVRLWATYYGGSGSDFLADCVTDPSGRLYATGYTMSGTIPTMFLPGAYNQPLSGGATDAFLLRFSPTGVLQWATFFGGAGSDYLFGLATDATGRLFAVGSSSSSAGLPVLDPGGGAYYQPAPVGAVDAMLVRFSAADALEWCTLMGGEGYDDAGGVTIGNGDLYVTGYTQSVVFPTMDPGGGAYFEGAPQGSDDAFIGRFSLGGVQSWTTRYGGASTDYADQPAVDGSGNLFVFGDTYSADFPALDPGGGAYFQTAPAGLSDFFLLKFTSANVRVWATSIGGSGLEISGFSDRPLAINPQGEVVVTGMTNSSDLQVLDPGGGSFYDGVFNGDRDGMIAQFDNSGVPLWLTYFGTDLFDFGSGLSFGLGGCLFATGEVTGATGFTPVNPGFGAWFQGTPVADHEGYILKFCVPNSACCLDFICVPVSSQDECTAMGGTQFFPLQTCLGVNCTINCTICGRKFNDLDRDGVQDPGEPGLAGWTIALHYPNGPLFATTTTDGNGDYCFNDIPCGTWTVSEVQQPGWVQTFPAGPHTVTLGTGGTQNGVHFANHSCPTAPPCVGVPPNLAAWWPFNDGPGATAAQDVTHARFGRNQAVPSGGGTAALPDAMCFASPADLARVAAGDQLDLGVGMGSFAIASWLLPSSSGTGVRPVVDRRSPATASTPPSGYALQADGLQGMLELAAGGATQMVPGPTLTPDVWSHLAVSVDRSSGLGRWYLNGDPVAALDFVPLAGFMRLEADVVLGQANPAIGTSTGFQGCLGDVAVFSKPLTDAAARKAYDPGNTGWCPERALMPSVRRYCASDSSIQLCFNLVNQTASPQTYNWSLAGLPIGPGCTIAGPTDIVPSAGVVTVPAGGTSPAICVTIRRPPGLVTPSASSCVALTFMNAATGVCRTRSTTLRADFSCWCAQPPAGVVDVAARVPSGAVISMPIENPCDPIASIGYQWSAAWLEPEHPDPMRLSLNGLPPGAPASGVAASGSTVEVSVGYPEGYDFAARYEVVLEADLDGDGTPDRLGSAIVQPTHDLTGAVATPAPAAPARSVRLTARPNPFSGGSSVEFVLGEREDVTLAIYDLNGRLVRSLARGMLPAGPHRFAWDGRDAHGRHAPAGIYFARLTGAAHPVEAKLVKMR